MKIRKEQMPFKSAATKNKYNINNDDVIVVEKNNMLYNMVTIIVKIVCYTILLTLALIGIVAILVPESREILLHQAVSVFDEFISLIGIGGE